MNRISHLVAGTVNRRVLSRKPPKLTEPQIVVGKSNLTQMCRREASSDRLKIWDGPRKAFHRAQDLTTRQEPPPASQKPVCLGIAAAAGNFLGRFVEFRSGRSSM
jgi:hypothetical protein